MKPPVIPRFITNRILLNGAIDLEAARFLKKQGVTHLINLAGAYAEPETFHELGLETREFEISDQTQLDCDRVMQILEEMDSILNEDENKIYIHCVAGQVRSPTMAWLYLLYTGHSEDHATELLSRCKLSPSSHLLHGLNIERIKPEQDISAPDGTD